MKVLPAAFNELLSVIRALDAKPSEGNNIFEHRYASRRIIQRAIHKLIILKKSSQDQDVTKDVEGLQNPDLKVTDSQDQNIDLLIDSVKNGDRDDKSQFAEELIHVMKFYLAENFLETEERQVAEPMFKDVQDFFISSDEVKIRYSVILLKATNWMGIIWSQRGELDRSKEFLQKSVNRYHNCIQNADNLDQSDLKEVELVHTHTLFYLAQWHQSQGNQGEAADMCRQTLERQLRLQHGEFAINEWSANAVGIAKFFQEQNRFRQAIHCLEAAQAVSPDTGAEDDDSRELQAKIHHGFGEFYRQWLETSASTLLNVDADDYDEFESAITCPNELEEFPTLSLRKPEPFTLILNYEEAFEAFSKAIQHFGKVLEIWLLDGFVTQHIEVLQSISKCWQCVAYFENDPKRKCRMHRRRINILRDVVIQLNPAAFLATVRSLHHEIADAYRQMGDTKTEQYENGRSDIGFVRKINEMYRLATEHHEMFVKSYDYPPKNNEISDLPFSLELEQTAEKSEIDKELYYEYLVGKFHIANICTKFIHRNTEQQILATQKAIDTYKFIVDFYKKKGPVEEFKDQYEVAKEMYELLPYKIRQLSNASAV